MICGSTKQIDEENSCQGDSGGPLICEVNGRAVMAGITSFGPQCSSFQHPAEFARVSNYVQFIETHQNNGKFISRSEGPKQAPSFARIAQRRADKSRIRRYCKRGDDGEFTQINLALQQKKESVQLNF